jgi:hypothetical protein
VGKQNTTPEEAAAEARKRAEIREQREAEAERKRLAKIAHDEEVARIKAEGEARRREALREALERGKRGK